MIDPAPVELEKFQAVTMYSFALAVSASGVIPLVHANTSVHKNSRLALASLKA